ncbi:uncharacterized protein LACBIDRAFT_329149 [Laccaria bicolor S238N-H82]|uniref:Predicted protein n=1 Tax=Laccaria bicolor (strain S238N-H82 / ATCC MYA-4686) TaxID=486041 RepID=B0DH78_LACBS|nr:uncharacterized protein LACBIDRAFT_329149 [Laccaria bicolor S238N-H82]EDR06062.1 predicted protein [Laccaria bicolor S238N-H82]|eukprot:XP_001883350.1 predicted protein [Laccaria bicolor S238N-H82]
MSTLATVEPTSAKAPVLTEGDVSPAVMMDFENAALDFFVSKSIPAEKQVTMIIPGIKDLRIQDWIAAERTRLVTLEFPAFMSEMRANYLHQDWEDQIRNKILTSTLTSSKTSFWNWSQQLLKLNCLLRGTTSFFDDTALRNHLEAHLDDELRARLKNSEARKEKALKPWINSVRIIDEARAVENKRARELIEETIDRQAKHQNTKTDVLRGSSRRANTSQSNSTSANSSSSSFVKLPPLTDDERALLNEHDGCTKCCRFYCDHHSQSCPDGFPSGKNYKTLTVAFALAAKKAKAVAKHTAKPVAATAASIEEVDSDDDLSATVAVLPNSPGNYASDSDEDWDVSHRDVSNTSIRSKHLIWNCQINSLTNDFPVKTRALIDNGAHLVLIRPELVERLGLKQYKLNKPELVDVAFSNGKKKKTELYFYVKLALSSLDSAWTSHVVKALVTPGLCLPIILGLPWLERNFIVTDHAARTCIDKRNSYDLLNPPDIVPPPPPKPRLQHVKDFDVAGAVRDRIDVLVAQEQLATRETALKTEYKEIFEPIPHADELPRDIVAEIQIKNAEKTIKSRSYPSPRKYKQAWQI